MDEMLTGSFVTFILSFFVLIVLCAGVFELSKKRK